MYHPWYFRHNFSRSFVSLHLAVSLANRRQRRCTESAGAGNICAVPAFSGHLWAEPWTFPDSLGSGFFLGLPGAEPLLLLMGSWFSILLRLLFKHATLFEPFLHSPCLLKYYLWWRAPSWQRSARFCTERAPKANIISVLEEGDMKSRLGR